MLDHGGGILAAARRYGIPVGDWLDLSTGLNPHGWPVGNLPAEVWQRLPQEHDGLEDAAAAYYGSPSLLPVAGSQAAIQSLPLLRTPGSRVGMLAASYAEHAHAWARHGHVVTGFAEHELLDAVAELDVVLVCNPNNPTGWQVPPETLLGWRENLAARGGWLIVDEAFMDCTPQHSLVPFVGEPGLIVLRSLGKFFGLAGARVGFVFAWRELLDALREELGPWTISGPGRAVAKAALRDTNWQVVALGQLTAESARLAALLTEHGLPPAGGTALFQWLTTPHAAELHDFLAARGILIRHFATSNSVRFGLPADEGDWKRLAAALADFSMDSVTK
ncbi:threonine-phosphate decarboxylase CobD [Andreprevotia chitinilytica]|uniref:threonine-phosphate decarboxylase CobD n=1 Tax=Andreprevotia chitinilytica TaxID=396808 RepID=UPI000557130A|nr:threonine-phosphate decarboxylase CobD [Andreprevotia chitinilytica]